MMVVARCFETEQHLKQAVQVGRCFQVPAACHVGDALAMVVDDDREVIARRHVLAHDHGIAPPRRIGDDLVLATIIVEGDVADPDLT